MCNIPYSTVYNHWTRLVVYAACINCIRLGMNKAPPAFTLPRASDHHVLAEQSIGIITVLCPPPPKLVPLELISQKGQVWK